MNGRDTKTAHSASRAYATSVPRKDGVRATSPLAGRRDFEAAQVAFDHGKQKESPADAAAGLSNESDQTGVWLTGEMFSAAFRRITQARDIIDDVVGCWRAFDEGRPEGDIEAWEYSVMRRTLRDAEALYKECYRGYILNDFENLFYHTYETFEVSLNELKRIYGDA